MQSEIPHTANFHFYGREEFCIPTSLEIKILSTRRFNSFFSLTEKVWSVRHGKSGQFSSLSRNSPIAQMYPLRDFRNKKPVENLQPRIVSLHGFFQQYFLCILQANLSCVGILFILACGSTCQWSLQPRVYCLHMYGPATCSLLS